MLKEGLSLDDVKDVGFCLVGPVNWAGREAQVEKTVGTVQEGHQTIADGVVGKRTKPGDQNTHKEQRRQARPSQQPTTLKSECKA